MLICQGTIIQIHILEKGKKQKKKILNKLNEEVKNNNMKSNKIIKKSKKMFQVVSHKRYEKREGRKTFTVTIIIIIRGLM